MIYWILQTLNWFHRTFLTSFYIFMAGGSIAFLMPWKFMINSIRWGLAPSELFLSKWSCLGLCNEILLFLCIEPNLLVFSYSQALVSWWEDGSSERKILTWQTGTNDTDTTGSHTVWKAWPRIFDNLAAPINWCMLLSLEHSFGVFNLCWSTLIPRLEDHEGNYSMKEGLYVHLYLFLFVKFSCAKISVRNMNFEKCSSKYRQDILPCDLWSLSLSLSCIYW